jgi:hypothetical protein
MIVLKQSTSVTLLVGPFVDDSDGNTAETGLTITQADVRLSKNGGNMAQKNDATSLTHDELGYYTCPLDTTDTNTLGQLKIMVHESGALPVWVDCLVVTANVYDTLCSTDQLDVNVTNIEGSDPTDQIRDSVVDDTTRIDASALNVLSGHDPGENIAGVSDIPGLNDLSAADVNAEVDTALTDIHLDHLLAADYDPASKPGVGTALLNELVESDAGVSRFTENALEQAPSGTGASADTIANAVWDEALADHVAAGSAGEAQGRLDDIQTDTEDLQTQIGTAGDGLTNIPWNASWDAEVQSECNDALTAYDPPTKNELDTGLAGLNDPTAASIADAVWDEASAGHTDAGKAGQQLWTDVDAILEDTNELQTDDIPGAISGLNDVSVAEVNGACDDALTDYDPPTNTEMENRTLPATDYFDPTSDTVTVGTNSDKTGYRLSATGVDDILDELYETGRTLREFLRLASSVLFSKSSGGGTASLVFRDQGDTKNRVTATVDENGNRTGISLDDT